MSLVEADFEKRDKVVKFVSKVGPIVSIASYVAGLVYFCLLSHETLIHRTYISENALLPGKLN